MTTHSPTNAAIIRMLIAHATADASTATSTATSVAHALELIPMGCWEVLRYVNRDLAAAYHTARALFPGYLRQRLCELMSEDLVRILTTDGTALAGDFMVDCVWGLRRPLSIPVIIVAIVNYGLSRLRTQPGLTEMPPFANLVYDMYAHARRPGNTYHADFAVTKQERKAGLRGGGGYADAVHIKAISAFDDYYSASSHSDHSDNDNGGNADDDSDGDNASNYGTYYNRRYGELVTDVVGGFDLLCYRTVYSVGGAPAGAFTTHSVGAPIRPGGRLYVADIIGPVHGPTLRYNTWLWHYAGKDRYAVVQAATETASFYMHAGLLGDDQ